MIEIEERKSGGEIIRKQISILNALAKDYMGLCLINRKSRTAKILKASGEKIREREFKRYPEISYEEMCQKTIMKFAPEELREEAERMVSLPVLWEKLSENGEYSFVCEVSLHGERHDCLMKYLKLDEPDYILCGFQLVDNILAKEKQQKDKLAQEIVVAEARKRKDAAAIKRSATELQKERMFLDVLCQDYTSVYYFDIENNTLEVLKMDTAANAANIDALQLRQKTNYSDNMEVYCQKYVSEYDKEEFKKVMSRENIRKKLESAERFIYRYQSNPNVDGHKYFEAQVVRISREGFEHTAILAFRHIDDIITAEQERQKELKEALQKERITNEVLMAISKIYYAIFRIDLEKDTYEELSSDSMVHHLTGKSGCASQEMKELCRSVVVPEYQERILQFFDVHTLAERLQNEETIAEEYLAQDGNWHTARFIVKRRNAEGKVTNVLYVTRLISDAKRREQNWIAIAEAANQANQAKTDFLRHMSHDIRTPINGILGMLEMAERHKDDVKKLQECRRKTLGATEYLLSLVNNVLDIGKLESNEIILENRSFDLIELLMKQLPVIEIQANEHGIRYQGGKEMSLIRHRYLIGSPVHLNRILMNVAGNAIKYNRKGGSVTVYCTEISNDEKTAVYQFICADTGMGMSEAFQKRAFEPFTQEGKETISTYNGSGLGLSIVKKFAEEMNGTVELKSREGVGTTVIITIPFTIDADAQERAMRKEEAPALDLTGKKALLVEDDELNQEIAKMLLEDEGLVITTAENGEEAVKQFVASPDSYYDFVFMDIMMPVMDGLEATRRIRALDRADAGTVPIIAMTANAFQDDIEQSLRAGMNAHLMKPIDVQKLKKALRDNVRK